MLIQQLARPVVFTGNLKCSRDDQVCAKTITRTNTVVTIMCPNANVGIVVLYQYHELV